MSVAVIGTGYVGLVTGTCLANTGQEVTCVDKDPAVVESLRGGTVPIFEEGLDHMVEENVEHGRLSFTTDTAEAVRGADVVFIAVGTPPREDGSADLGAVDAVAAEIGDSMEGRTVIVCKSTVPVGTCDRVAALVGERTEHDYEVVSNPEFLKEGTAVSDFQSPDRVVIGCEDEQARETIAELYRPFMQRNERFVFTDRRSAEMIKYASNAMLATKISFINEVANICDRVDADIEEVRRGMSMDQRIGPHFIYPGVGFGGSCFPKDVRALSHLGEGVGLEPGILEAVINVNVRQKLYLFGLAQRRFESMENMTIAVWGLSFKPKTDDIREAPALANIRKFVEAGATVRATDPEAIDNARAALADVDGDIEFVEDAYAALEGADALFVFTEWEQFRHPNWERMSQVMDEAIVFDGRNIYRPEKLAEFGIEYHCVGRPT